MKQSTLGGLHIQYYVLCERKLWLYDRGISMEHESDRVLEGTVMHEQVYPRLRHKEIVVDNSFKVDAFDGEYVRETKISSKMKHADRMQMLFYLYQLCLRGIHKKGLLSYTKERDTVEVALDDESKQDVKQAIAKAYRILEKPHPPKVINAPYCKTCAYYTFCYAMEWGENNET